MRLILLGTLVFLLLPSFVVIAWLSYHPRLNVQTIEVVGTDKLNPKTLETFLAAELDDGNVHIFSPRNELLLSRNELAAALSAKFPRIKSVKIPFTKFRQKMLANIEERQPRFIWCDSKEEEKCYLADEHGYIFAPSSQTSDLQIIRNKIASTVPVRANIAKEELFANLKILLIDLAGDVSMKAVSIELLGNDAVVHLNKGWFIKVALDSDVNTQITNLKIVLDSQEFKKTRSDLEYIDLRFGKRVYYKYRGE